MLAKASDLEEGVDITYEHLQECSARWRDQMVQDLRCVRETANRVPHMVGVLPSQTPRIEAIVHGLEVSWLAPEKTNLAEVGPK